MMVFSLAAASSKKLQSCPTLRDPMNSLQLRLFCPWDSPGKYTGVLYHALLQGIFLSQGLNPPPLTLASGFFSTSATWESPFSLEPFLSVRKMYEQCSVLNVYT